MGPKGYREKAWKRLWEQTGRLDLILARKQILDSDGDGSGGNADEEDEATMVAGLRSVNLNTSSAAAAAAAASGGTMMKTLKLSTVARGTTTTGNGGGATLSTTAIGGGHSGVLPGKGKGQFITVPASIPASVSVSVSISVPAACLRLLTESYLTLTAADRKEREEKFARLVKVWELGREKHERQLRPR
jgi:hypothetical protein